MIRRLLAATLLNAVLCLTNSSVGWGLQLSEMRDSVRRRVRDTTTDTSRQQFSDTQVNAALNEAQRNFINQTWVLSNTTSFPLINPQREYYMPSDFIVPLRVVISSVSLKETTLHELDGEGVNWTTSVSTPNAYYMERTFGSNVVMGFYPLPRSTTTFNVVKVYYAQQGTEMSSDSDEPFRSRIDLQQYSDCLVDYASGILWLTQGIPELAKPYFELYTARIDRVTKNLGSMPNYNPSLSGNRGPRQ